MPIIFSVDQWHTKVNPEHACYIPDIFGPLQHQEQDNDEYHSQYELHTARHVHYIVNGVLIGRCDMPGGNYNIAQYLL